MFGAKNRSGRSVSGVSENLSLRDVLREIGVQGGGFVL